MKNTKHIDIVGAGIAGLTTALAMAERGHTVRIFEQSPALEEIGAGLQLSPNATRVFDTLGLRDDLADVWYEPDHLQLVSGLSLRTLARLPVRTMSRDRWKAPYAVIHRARLQDVLMKACRRFSSIEFEFGKRIETPMRGDADVTVGADGVWSSLRRTVRGSAEPRFSGYAAWRATMPIAELPASFSRTDVTALLGPGAHLVIYRIGSETINLVATIPEHRSEKGWNLKSDAGRLLSAFKRWHASIGIVLAKAEWRHWPIYEVADASWRGGDNTILIGDAAHAMAPHAAQGAAMAIEDSYELASWLDRTDIETATALMRFEAHRRPRIRRVGQRGLLNKFAYQAIGPFRLGRDIVFTLRGGQSLLADLDWLYGYEAG
ncbi:MAG: salicylate hydroxylase [Rhizobiaceae bacterium MnEN-MB40S]|nr:MAG: salicylate hydroxylase [Rhizobiaceae bacterium MnEN-MB40S]